MTEECKPAYRNGENQILTPSESDWAIDREEVGDLNEQEGEDAGYLAPDSVGRRGGVAP